jgi:hypothetical protein
MREREREREAKIGEETRQKQRGREKRKRRQTHRDTGMDNMKNVNGETEKKSMYRNRERMR